MDVQRCELLNFQHMTWNKRTYANKFDWYSVT